MSDTLYYLFSWGDYDAVGGLLDYHGRYTPEDAFKVMKTNDHENGHLAQILPDGTLSIYAVYAEDTLQIDDNHRTIYEGWRTNDGQLNTQGTRHEKRFVFSSSESGAQMQGVTGMFPTWVNDPL